MLDQSSIRCRPEERIPTLRELAMVLFRRRRVFLLVSLAVFGAAVFYAFTGTKYKADMQVLVRKGRADAPVSAGENAPLDLTHMGVTEEEINSEVELLRDEELLRRVVNETGAESHDLFRSLRFGEGPDQRLERAARRLAKKISVEPLKKTNLIAISYSSADPRVSAMVLHSLANAYLDKHTSVHRPVGELGFFEQQTSESRRQLEEANERLLNFTQVQGVVAAAQQRDLTIQKLSDLDGRERQNQIEISETQQRIRELEDLLSKLPERTTTQERTADNPELLKALKSSLLDLQLKRTQLLTKFEPHHRLVQEVEQQIAQTEKTIAAESVSPVRDEITDKNSHYEWATAELQQARVQLQSLRARDQATRFQQVACRSLAAKFGADAITQDDLVNTKKAAEENYLLYVRKKEEARMSDALDERGIVNVAIAEQPVAPALPVWSALTILVVGFIGAATSGTAVAFAADYLDPSFRDPEDVVAYLDAPVLASLPRSHMGLSA